MKIRKVVLPVAGLGTRFLPASKCIPKEMFPIVDKPVIQWLMEECAACGIEEVIFVTARGKYALEDHFDSATSLMYWLEAKDKTGLADRMRSLENLVRVTAVRQKHPLGLGHAIWCAKEAVGNEPFAVILGDELVLSKKPAIGQLIDASERLGGSAIAVDEVPADQTDRYGIVDGEEIEPGIMRLSRLVEKPKPEQAPSCMAITGRYVLPAEIFEILENTEKGQGGEIQLTDGLNELARRPNSPMFSVQLEGKRLDAGSPLGLLQTSLCYAMEDERYRADVLNIMEELLETSKAK